MAREAGGRQLVPVADVALAAQPAAAVQLRPADETRVACYLRNLDAKNAFRIGDSTVTANIGTRVSPHALVRYTGTAALWALSESAGVSVSLTEETA